MGVDNFSVPKTVPKPEPGQETPVVEKGESRLTKLHWYDGKSVEDLMKSEKTKIVRAMEEVADQINAIENMHLENAGSAITELQGKLTMLMDAVVGIELKETGGDVEKLQSFFDNMRFAVQRRWVEVSEFSDETRGGLLTKNYLIREFENAKRRLNILETALAKAQEKGV